MKTNIYGIRYREFPDERDFNHNIFYKATSENDAKSKFNRDIKKLTKRIRALDSNLVPRLEIGCVTQIEINE